MKENLAIPNGMDTGAVNLARAIRKQESGGDYNKSGDSGSSLGAYQWNNQPNGKSVPLQKGEIPSNFKSTAKEVGLDENDFSPTNQDMVAYRKIKKLKDEGNNVVDIAAIWNGGSKERQDPNYVTPSGLPSQKKGVYDVPGYAKAVNNYYQDLKSKTEGGQVQADAQNPSSIANTTPIEKPEGEPGMIRSTAGSIYNSLAAPLVGLAALPVQAGVAAYNKITDSNVPDPYAQGIPSLGKENTQVSKLGVKEKLGDTAQVASYVAPTKGLGGLIASGVLQGGGMQASQGADTKEILKSGLIGGTIGGGLGLAGKAISKVGEVLPTKLVRSFIPKINEKTTEHALMTKKLGSLESVLNQTDASIESLGKSLDNALNNPVYANQRAQGNDIMSQVAVSLPDAGLTADDIVANLKRVAPMKSGLLDKFRKGTLSLKELHSLNFEIGKNVYKTVFDDPTMKANKDIGNAFYHIVSDYIKKTAPETVPLFEDISKELPLRAGLKRATNAGEKSRPITVADLVTFGIGSVGSPMTAIGMVVAKKALQSPTLNLKTAGLLKKGTSETARKSAAIATPIVTSSIRGLLPKNPEKP